MKTVVYFEAIFRGERISRYVHSWESFRDMDNYYRFYGMGGQYKVTFIEYADGTTEGERYF